MTNTPKPPPPSLDREPSILDLIDLIFHVSAGEEGEEPAIIRDMETMTTAEVCEYLGTTRSQLGRWKERGLLVPVAHGEYEAEAVKSFVKPTRGTPLGSKNKSQVRSIMQN